MKLKKHLGMAAVIVAVALVFTCVGAYAATNAGSQSDPLVTVSYLTKTLQPSMESQFDAAVTSAMTEVEKQFESELTGEFAVVNVAAGKTMRCSSGCELLFRSGTASAVGTMSDVTEGSGVTAGKAMNQNHLYMACADNSGFTASTAVTVLARGTYTIG